MFEADLTDIYDDLHKQKEIFSDLNPTNKIIIAWLGRRYVNITLYDMIAGSCYGRN
jgi:hypothetical protein